VEDLSPALSYRVAECTKGYGIRVQYCVPFVSENIRTLYLSRYMSCTTKNPYAACRLKGEAFGDSDVRACKYATCPTTTSKRDRPNARVAAVLV
jgi:hypothetical protein